MVIGAYRSAEESLRTLARDPLFHDLQIDLHATLAYEPNGGKSFSYDGVYIDQAVENACRYVLLKAEISASKSDNTLSGRKDDGPCKYVRYNTIVLLFRSASNEVDVIERFANIPLFLSFPNELRNRSLTDLLKDIGGRLDAVESVLHKQVSPNAHRGSPLMLPSGNFISPQKDRLFQQVKKISAIDLGPRPLPAHLDDLKKSIQRTRKVLRDKAHNGFVDERMRRYEPSDEHHGGNRLGGNSASEELCALAGCFRFGVPYPMDFHYNTTHIRSVATDFVDCLGRTARLTPGKHINIAPNDHIR